MPVTLFFEFDVILIKCSHIGEKIGLLFKPNYKMHLDMKQYLANEKSMSLELF